MYCKNCGKEIGDNAYICSGCGVKVYGHGPGDGPIGCLLGGVCFLWPIVGLILYLSWKEEKPYMANSAGKQALLGLIISVVIGLIYYVSIFSSITG